MAELIVCGGVPLRGETEIQGAKNSVLPILAATLLAQSPCTVRGCPALTDVDASCAILRHLGAKAEREGDTVTVSPGGLTETRIPDDLMQTMRSSVLFLGPLLSRTGRAEISLPGGCELGPRPVDLHLLALRALGAQVTAEGEKILCRGKLRGGKICFSYPSVGATENAMMAAATAAGVTTISGAACEPEICGLAEFLRAMGAHITGDGTPELAIEGVPELHGADYRVMPDRIVTATWLAAGAAAGGEIALRGAEPAHLLPVIETMRQAGAEIALRGDVIELRAGRLHAPEAIVTAPYPGFPTDAQAPVMAALLRAEGVTRIRETVFSARFSHVPELRRLGASIAIEGDTAHVTGVSALHGALLRAKDLRGGAAAVVGALGAEGESRITGLTHIDRGYADMARDLRNLGAQIKRLESGGEIVYTT